MSPLGPLLIVGASGRAAAASAIRAGFEPFVIDLFADEDTKRLCPVLKCPLEEYPHGFIELSKQAPPGPWMFTGGLENYAEVVEEISHSRSLRGNGPDVLPRVRDPFQLVEICRQCGIAFPSLVPNSQSTKKWLRKSRKSSGGLGVRDWDGNESFHAEEYLQEFIPGEPMSAVFDSPRLLGVTRQLIGEPWLHAKPYNYCGNISRKAGSLAEPLQEIGQQFIRHFGLCEIWGIDFIKRDEQPVVVEINPRYTASLEVLQFGKNSASTIGKAIYYAAQTFTFPANGPWQDSLDRCTEVWNRPDFADIPAPGAHIEKGQPVLTFLDEAKSEVVLIEQLKSRAAKLDKIFGIAAERQT